MRNRNSWNCLSPYSSEIPAANEASIIIIVIERCTSFTQFQGYEFKATYCLCEFEYLRSRVERLGRNFAIVCQNIL